MEAVRRQEPSREAGAGALPEPDGVAGSEASRASRGLAEQVSAAFGMQRARLDPGPIGTRALGVLAVVVVVIAAAIAWWSQPEPEPVATPRIPAPSVSASAGAGATGVVVAVAGKVRRPGLVTLAPGARVADAIEAAGGVLPGTDIGYLNLARKVTDGELIVVGETPPPGAAGGTGSGTVPGDPAGKVNLNTATLQQLDTLPGVGAVLGQRILDYRTEHGGFRSVDELRQVDGIGPARYEQLKDLVTV
ncbi:MAG: helix-hairpin-helix domain-containing protein [Micromonosporaceae bacterium]